MKEAGFSEINDFCCFPHYHFPSLILPNSKNGILDYDAYENKDRITLKFISKSFLQQQVRSMVGCIKYLGDGKWKLDDFKKSFKSKNRHKCAPPAPAYGLYLAKIKY